jgi:hypothetical protein
LFFAEHDAMAYTKKFGDGVPLITARAGLMTPADSDVRQEYRDRPDGGFFV